MRGDANIKSLPTLPLCTLCLIRYLFLQSPPRLRVRGKSGTLSASGEGTLREALRSIGWGSIFMQLHIKLV